jgi:hypothetical protein
MGFYFFSYQGGPSCRLSLITQLIFNNLTINIMCNINTNYAGTRDAANRVIRFDIRKGKFAQWMGLDQERREYDFVQGFLTGISLRKHEMPSGEMTYLDIHFVNGDTRFNVSAIASGSVAAELISKLVNIRDLKSLVRIDVWQKEQFTNCTVYENGEKLPFRILPKVEKKQRGFSASFDTSERDSAVMAMIDELNARIAQASRN